MTPASGVIPPSQQAAVDAETAPAAELSDAQIAAISDTANSAEVEQARVALDRARDPRVREFAQMMLDHHGQARRDQADLLGRLNMAPAESPQSLELLAHSTDALVDLRAADDADFDRTYIDAQVQAHERVLTSLDTQLIPGADQPELKRLLQDLRPRIEEHLRRARELAESLQAPPPSGNTGTLGGTEADDYDYDY